MADFAEFIKLLHVVSAIMMLAGGIERQLTRRQADQTDDICTLQQLLQPGGRFENWLAIPGSILVFLSGFVIAVMRGWPLFGFLQGTSANWLLVSIVLYLALYPLVIFIFIPRGRAFATTLAEAVAQGRITAELRAAFHDPTVRRAHYLEYVLMAAILYLMVMKPF